MDGVMQPTDVAATIMGGEGAFGSSTKNYCVKSIIARNLIKMRDNVKSKQNVTFKVNAYALSRKWFILGYILPPCSTA
jgi:hypothetical protein